MRSFFTGSSSSEERADATRTSRHSSGWAHLQKYLAASEGLRILDIGPTSAVNINYVTSLGHSIYMANLVDEAARPEWIVPTDAGDGSTQFDVDRFLAANLDFAGRMFDVVTFWDTADYLPPALLAPVMARIHSVMQPGGLLLAFFHAKATGAETSFSRYHLTATDSVEIQRAAKHPLLQTYNNRQIEKLLSDFTAYKFFLAKDNLSEVVATR